MAKSVAALGRAGVSEQGLNATVTGIAAWRPLAEALDALPECLADLRSPLPERMGRLAEILRQVETSALAITGELVVLRDRLYPDPTALETVPHRYPQPDPTLVLALREWIMSLASEPTVPLLRQKQLNKVLTQILVARAALLTYSEQLHDDRPDILVRVLSAVWVLVAETWKARPLLGEGASGDHGRTTEDD